MNIIGAFDNSEYSSITDYFSIDGNKAKNY